MDKYFDIENLNKICTDESLAKRLYLAYNLLSPVRATSDDYPKDVVNIHENYTSQFIESLKQVTNWQEYDNFLNSQRILEEQTRLKICAILHPQERRKQAKEIISSERIYNVSDLWGSPLQHFLSSDFKFTNLKMKMQNDPSAFSMGDEQNLKALNDFVESFVAGINWAKDDNNKVASEISKQTNFSVTPQTYEGFIASCGFDYIRYPIVHEDQKDSFISYLQECAELISKEYSIEKSKIGFVHNGLELHTTQDPAFYVPSTKAISLRLDMINAFYHEHFHALDHQVMLGIDLDKIKKMYGIRGSVNTSLASDIKLLEPEEIEDSANKSILLGFNSASDKMITASLPEDKESAEYKDLQEKRKQLIPEMCERFLREIYQKLELDPAPFEPVIQEIMKSFTSIEKSPEFEKVVAQQLKTLTDEKFKESHANYYTIMSSRIHFLYNHLDDKTLFYNFSLINDNYNKKGYFSSKPEMLARAAETYFFQKYPHTQMTPPEWWDSNSYLFYPQKEEKELIAGVFKDTIEHIKNNAQAFVSSIAKKNIKKSFRL